MPLALCFAFIVWFQNITVTTTEITARRKMLLQCCYFISTVEPLMNSFVLFPGLVFFQYYKTPSNPFIKWLQFLLLSFFWLQFPNKYHSVLFTCRVVFSFFHYTQLAV